MSRITRLLSFILFFAPSVAAAQAPEGAGVRVGTGSMSSDAIESRDVFRGIVLTREQRSSLFAITKTWSNEATLHFGIPRLIGFPSTGNERARILQVQDHFVAHVRQILTQSQREVLERNIYSLRNPAPMTNR